MVCEVLSLQKAICILLLCRSSVAQGHHYLCKLLAVVVSYSEVCYFVSKEPFPSPNLGSPLSNADETEIGDTLNCMGMSPFLHLASRVSRPLYLGDYSKGQFICELVNEVLVKINLVHVLSSMVILVGVSFLPLLF